MGTSSFKHVLAQRSQRSARQRAVLQPRLQVQGVSDGVPVTLPDLSVCPHGQASADHLALWG